MGATKEEAAESAGVDYGLQNPILIRVPEPSENLKIITLSLLNLGGGLRVATGTMREWYAPLHLGLVKPEMGVGIFHRRPASLTLSGRQRSDGLEVQEVFD